MLASLLCAILSILLVPQALEATGGKAIIAYVFSRNRTIAPSEIDAGRLTHINYAFANIVDGRIAEGFPADPENFRILAGIRRQHPHLKILISVGGWTWSGRFSEMARTPENRARFVASAIDFVTRHDLDGIDIDWEYPGMPGIGNPYRPQDRENFTSLMVELRSALDREGKARKRTYLLTFAAGANVPEFIEHVELPKLRSVVDFVNLMTYDFRAAGEDALAGHHSNLYANPADDKRLSADRAVRDYMAAGVPASRIVLGVPFYGKPWVDVEADNSGLYQPGKASSVRIDASFANLSAAFINRNGYVRCWDPQAQAPYLWNADQRIFITYDDPESLRLKCEYIRRQNLGGVMFWEYYSDTTGTLLGTLFQELRAK